MPYSSNSLNNGAVPFSHRSGYKPPTVQDRKRRNIRTMPPQQHYVKKTVKQKAPVYQHNGPVSQLPNWSQQTFASPQKNTSPQPLDDGFGTSL